ncbi:MAG: LytTR family DNA-binding domain-containing protein [Saprospiraceae bacterium]|nr:LytTR family DNA-binding domain-containing protein [Saprospiraceae bacterium]
MEVINCLIVDDEQLARDMLEVYCQRLGTVSVVAKCKNAMEALEHIQQNTIDILLSDIEMPMISGLEFVAQLPYQPKVIFTTAYKQYALEGYQLEVLDYLVKPISFDRFAKAMTKAMEHISLERKAQQYDEIQEQEKAFIIIKEGYDKFKIYLHQLRYIEAMREYVVYHTHEGRHMELRSLTSLEKELPMSQFLRVHRSYIVAKEQVHGWQGKQLLLEGGTAIPVGKTYRAKVVGVI